MRRYLAELIGTFVLVFGGVGTAVLAGDKVGYLGVAFAFGLSLLTMAYAIGPVSGCHINPAVTVGFLVVRKISPRDAAGYIAGQVIGGIAAAAVLLIVAKSLPGGYDASAEGFGSNGYGTHSPTGYHLGGVIVVEILLTALLVFTVMACTDKIAVVGFAGIPIGLTLTLSHLISIPVDNTSVNPARSIGPALFAGSAALSQLWVFLVMPFVGGIIGAFAYRALFTGAPAVATETSAVATESSTGRQRRHGERSRR